MKLMRHAALSLSIVLLTASFAFAQGTTGGTGTGTGTGAPTTGGPATTPGTGPNKDIDLPVDRPPPPPPPVVPPPPPPPKDPPPDKPPTIYGQEIKSENHTIFYVLDISGSMGWDEGQYTKPDGSTARGNRLDRAKSELVKSVASLPDNFKFDMLGYDCGMFPWKGAMQKADSPHKAAAIGWIMAQQPQGGTATGPAGAAGVRVPDNKLVVLLTDGDPNCGAGDGWGGDSTIQSHRAMIRGANKQNCVVNVYGIGASGSLKAFCQAVAADNGGTYTDVR